MNVHQTPWIIMEIASLAALARELEIASLAALAREYHVELFRFPVE